ncbi:MAG: DNA repair protein RadA, partial [Candidatus Binatia bacterium]
MARDRTLFACQNCGYQTPKWMGRCPDCGQWETLVEERIAAATPRLGPVAAEELPQLLSEVAADAESRRETGIGELDRVLGGGLVKGSVILIGGDPGIGKSTLLLQGASALGARGERVLYVSGEESPQQIRMRADRLGLAADQIYVLCETSLATIVERAEALEPSILAIDSIQTVFSSELTSAPGSIGQVRESAARFVAFAKRTGAACFLVGHVTKEGSLAGPRVLEHMVDTVLYFEGDRGHAFRVLRAVKNRFGSTNEIGVFEMKEAGLQAVANPSELFLAERPLGVAGSVVVAAMEGTRPILVEIQALVTPSAFGTPRRTTLGIEPGRVALLTAVLEKKVGLQLTGQDVFVNVAGGFRIDEPAADLATIVAVASSFLDRAIDPRTLVVGEVGLAGEVRGVGQVEARVREAEKMGFERALLPMSGTLHPSFPYGEPAVAGEKGRKGGT